MCLKAAVLYTPNFSQNTARQVHVWCNPFASRTFPSWQIGLRRKQYAVAFHSGASFSSCYYFLQTTSASWAWPFFSNGQDTLQGQLWVLQARKMTQTFPQWRTGRKIRDGQDVVVQTLLTGPVWKWFLAGISPNIPFPCGLELPCLSTVQKISCASQRDLSQTWSLTLL